jgi:hypothetical protein
MATPVTGPRPCRLTVNLFSGARTVLPNGTEVLLTVTDGNQKQVHRDFHRASSITLEGLPFHDNFGDNYTVLASAKGYRQAGITPVKVSPRLNAIADLMLLKSEASYNFRDAKWETLVKKRPEYARILSAGAASTARERYSQLLEGRPAVLACLFNVLAAMEQIHLPDGTPLKYLRELIWERCDQDRFFAWADRTLVDQVVRSAESGQFAPEPGVALFHPGATRSYKQLQFGEANVQITFHENDTCTIDGVECVMVEPDIDYYRDLLSHALLEVAVNKLTQSVSDPRDVYILRWMAGRRAGVPNFEPPYHLA